MRAGRKLLLSGETRPEQAAVAFPRST
ncbi:MAG: hypothetical protein JWQ10_3926, partial [Herbaspirillum sp.]|nr:hypothetical protein [Herbaspirillum sp.]